MTRQREASPLRRRSLLGWAAAVAAGGASDWATAQLQAPPPPQAPTAEPDFSRDARERLLGGNDAAERLRRASARRALLDEAEALLAQGHAGLALETFERAALLLHAADTELGIVRAHMGLGDYRRALSFGAHAAGAHRDLPAGMALYAWLLHLGGQAVVAKRLLDAAFEAHPDSAPIAQARERLSSPWPQPGPAMLQGPWRTAPFAHAQGAAWTTEGCRGDAPGGLVVGTATLMPAGDAAWVPSALLPAGPATLCLRDGLGRTVPATTDGPGPMPLLTRLRLSVPLGPAPQTLSLREPFAGSPGSMVEYAPDATGAAAWPLTRQGFFMGQPGTGSLRRLGLDAPVGPRGGPVFDRAGHLAGIAVTDDDGRALLVAAAALPGMAARSPGFAQPSGMPAASPAVQGATPLMAGLDLGYERALRIALQLIVIPS